MNAGAEAARGEVLVFTDANSMFAVDALKEVVRPLRDKSIGLVTGVSRYPGETIGSAYQRYEQMLKGLESRLGVVAGADGALYAMRRELFKPLDPALINDFVHPILTSIAGAQSVMARDAFVLEEFSAAGEFARQVGWSRRRRWCISACCPSSSKQRRWRSIIVLTSHKMLRWLTAPMLAIGGDRDRAACSGRRIFSSRAGPGNIVRDGRGDRMDRDAPRHGRQGDLRLPVRCAELRAGGWTVAMFCRRSTGALGTEESVARGI